MGNEMKPKRHTIVQSIVCMYHIVRNHCESITPPPLCTSPNKLNVLSFFLIIIISSYVMYKNTDVGRGSCFCIATYRNALACR